LKLLVTYIHPIAGEQLISGGVAEKRGHTIKRKRYDERFRWIECDTVERVRYCRIEPK
jgi:uncharacterized protein YifN (PemK superfamily)